MEIKKFDQINENVESDFEKKLDVITKDMYEYTKQKCEKILDNQSNNIKNLKSFLKHIKKNLKSILGEGYITKIEIKKYNGNSYHVELQKYIIEIHFPLYYNDQSGKKWYADHAVKEEIKREEYEQYNIREIDLYVGFNDVLILLLAI